MTAPLSMRQAFYENDEHPTLADAEFCDYSRTQTAARTEIHLLAVNLLTPPDKKQALFGEKSRPRAGYRLQATGYRLEATGYRLEATGYGLQAWGYGLRATGLGLWAWGERGAAERANQ